MTQQFTDDVFIDGSADDSELEEIPEARGKKGYPRHMEALGIQKELPKRRTLKTKE